MSGSLLHSREHICLETPCHRRSAPQRCAHPHQHPSASDGASEDPQTVLGTTAPHGLALCGL